METDAGTATAPSTERPRILYDKSLTRAYYQEKAGGPLRRIREMAKDGEKTKVLLGQKASKAEKKALRKARTASRLAAPQP